MEENRNQKTWGFKSEEDDPPRGTISSAAEHGTQTSTGWHVWNKQKLFNNLLSLF